MGWWGPKCTEQCPDNCALGCLQDPVDQSNKNGECGACKDSKWHEKDCSKPCSEYCTNGKCDMTGVCFGCVKNRYGQTCESTCPENCVNGLCLRHNGHCKDCEKGFHGAECAGKCHKSCGACWLAGGAAGGPGEDDCTDCDDAAEVFFNGGKAGPCKCIDEGVSTARWTAANQIVLDTVVKRQQKCYCKSGKWPDLYLHPYKTMSGRLECGPGCPKGTGAIKNRCYPTMVTKSVLDGGLEQGRCESGHYQIDFDQSVCINVEVALIMYQWKDGDYVEPQEKQLCPNKPGFARITGLCLPELYKEWIESSASSSDNALVI